MGDERDGASQNVTEGVVEECLPQALYRVGLKNGTKILASLGGVARQTIVRVIPGDRVLIEIAPFDPSRGKIKVRLG
jgi:translation initiation factor IF-1